MLMTNRFCHGERGIGLAVVFCGVVKELFLGDGETATVRLIVGRLPVDGIVEAEPLYSGRAHAGVGEEQL